jgi:integrase
LRFWPWDGSWTSTAARGIELCRKKLTSLNIRKPGFHRVDQNTYLVVRKGKKEGSTTRSYVLRFERNGKARDMGLGRASDYTLAEVRERSRLVRAVSFEEASRGYIQGQLTRWTSEHATDWISSLRDWVHPLIGKMPVASIETADVLRVMQQPFKGGTFWTKRATTAQRCRSRIEIVLGWAGAQGHRQADIPNPARWKKHLEFLLSAPSKLAKPVPQPALPYAEMPAFMAALAKQDGATALALRFLCHAAVRTADVARCEITDVDLDAAVWKIASYSKSNLAIDVPLSPAALAIAREAAAVAPAIGNGTLLFPGVGEGAMNKLVRKMGYAGRMSPHGARAAFSSWANAKTKFESELHEIALGHKVGSKVRQAYNRTDKLEKRWDLMRAWSAFITGADMSAWKEFLIDKTAEVVPFDAERKRGVTTQNTRAAMAYADLPTTERV